MSWKAREVYCGTAYYGYQSSHKLEQYMYGSQLSFHLQAKKRLTWWMPYIKLYTVTGHNRNSNLLRHAPENRSSPRIAARKWLLKN
jgi:hypothetical protein